MAYIEKMDGIASKMKTNIEKIPAEEEKALPAAGKEAELIVEYGGIHDNRGVGVVEVILILVVLIALVLVFKTQLTSLVNTIFTTITKNANSVIK